MTIEQSQGPKANRMRWEV